MCIMPFSRYGKVFCPSCIFPRCDDQCWGSIYNNYSVQATRYHNHYKPACNVANFVRVHLWAAWLTVWVQNGRHSVLYQSRFGTISATCFEKDSQYSLTFVILWPHVWNRRPHFVYSVSATMTIYGSFTREHPVLKRFLALCQRWITWPVRGPK